MLTAAVSGDSLRPAGCLCSLGGRAEGWQQAEAARGVGPEGGSHAATANGEGVRKIRGTETDGLHLSRGLL